MLRRTTCEARDVTKTRQGSHLEELEQELKRNPCVRLEEHILRLKVAWGRACRARNPKHQAA